MRTGRRPGAGWGWTAAWRLVALLLVPLALPACERKGPGDPQERLLLIQLTAGHNNGRTVRWADLPVRGFLNGIGTEDEVNEWTRASNGRVTFAFVGGAS